jgi:hypothetical protein
MFDLSGEIEGMHNIAECSVVSDTTFSHGRLWNDDDGGVSTIVPTLNNFETPSWCDLHAEV